MFAFPRTRRLMAQNASISLTPVRDSVLFSIGSCSQVWIRSSVDFLQMASSKLTSEASVERALVCSHALQKEGDEIEGQLALYTKMLDSVQIRCDHGAHRHALNWLAPQPPIQTYY